MTVGKLFKEEGVLPFITASYTQDGEPRMTQQIISRGLDKVKPGSLSYTPGIPLVTKEISYEDLKALVGRSPRLLLVDVRNKDEFDKGHIPGSVHIPLDTVEAAFAMEPEAFKAKYGVTKPPLDAPELVFYCRSGRRAGAATDKACKLGYVNAYNYKGSYNEWSEKEGK